MSTLKKRKSDCLRLVLSLFLDKQVCAHFKRRIEREIESGIRKLLVQFTYVKPYPILNVRFD